MSSNKQTNEETEIYSVLPKERFGLITQLCYTAVVKRTDNDQITKLF